MDRTSGQGRARALTARLEVLIIVSETVSLEAQLVA
jgi:hypothetical protein